MNKIYTSILGNSQKLDGGAMFGNAPKALWERWIPADNLNRIDLSCRCLLIQDGTQNILLETGIGAFFPPKLQKRFGVVEQEHVLLNNLQKIGLRHEDIDIIVLSHLHFDHAGGLLEAFHPEQESHLLFPNAKYIVSKDAFSRSISPHPRDKASFIPHLQQELQDSQRLILVDGTHCSLLGDDYRFVYSHGHTPGLLCTEIQTPMGPILFGADLIPGCSWVHTPITMGYDRFPELLIDEKTNILQSLVQRSGYIFFTHDHKVALARVTQDQRGRFTTAQHQEHLHQQSFST